MAYRLCVADLEMERAYFKGEKRTVVPDEYGIENGRLNQMSGCLGVRASGGKEWKSKIGGAFRLPVKVESNFTNCCFFPTSGCNPTAARSPLSSSH
jgi:hypothetical protein